MTTALIACAATSGWPLAPAMPAAANGTSMNPPCAIDEYASMRTMFVWRSAARLPNVIDERGEHPHRAPPRVRAAAVARRRSRSR